MDYTAKMIVWLILIVVQNSSLSVTIPDGYRDLSKEFDKGDPRTKEAIVLMKGTPGAADAASINFVRAEHHPADKLDDPKQCAAFAEEMREHQHADGQTSSIVEGPTGKTCQIVLRYDRDKMSVVSTLLQGSKSTWIMTCAMRAANATALQQCQKTLGTVKLK